MSKDNQEKLRLVKFTFDYGRMGSLNGCFVLDESRWNELQKLIKAKHDVYFGEVLGKHSEVYGPIDSEDIHVVTEDQEWLLKAKELGVDLDTGYNPLDYVEDDEEDEED